MSPLGTQTAKAGEEKKQNDPRLHNVQATSPPAKFAFQVGATEWKKRKSWVCLELRATSHEHSRLVWLTVYSVRVNVLLSAVFLSVKMVKHTQIIYITKTEVTPFYYKYTICITKEYLELGITNMFVFQGRYRFLAIKEIDDQYLKVSAKYNLFKILFTLIFLLLYILPLNDNILLSTPLHVLVTLVCLQI